MGVVKKTVIVVCLLIMVCGATETKEISSNNGADFVGRMLEEGRTLIHHAMKRFMIILPAIFFKLGIAFTMLVLVTFVSINNGVIGFLLLVVGLSTVLARMQDARKQAALPYYAAVPTYHQSYHHDWDRSDKSGVETATKPVYSGYNQQYVYSPLSTYNPSYYANAKL